MINDIEVHNRPILFDRIQVSVSPDYCESETFLDCDSIKNELIEIRKKRKLDY